MMLPAVDLVKCLGAAVMTDSDDVTDVIVAIKVSCVNGTADIEFHCKPGCN